MTPAIDLTAGQHRTVLALLSRYLPNTTVWAYGSRVKWTSHPASDLDLVAFAKPDQAAGVAELREAFDDSDLPFRVDLFVWDDVPSGFRKRIEAEHVVLARRERPVRKRTKGWPKVTLGNCIEMNDATYLPTEQWPFVNYLDTGNITDNRIGEIQHLVAGEDKIPSRARRKVQLGDMLYSTVRPNQRHFGIMKKVPENFLASTGFSVIRGKDGCARTDFLYWFLAQDSVVEHLHTIAEHSTSAYPSIRPVDIERLTLNLPPLPEQRAIACILGALDDKIELNRRKAETLEGTVHALFKSWFVDFDPVRTKENGEELNLGKVAGIFPREVDCHTRKPIGWRMWGLAELATYSRVSVSPYRQPEATFEHYSIPAHDAGRQPILESGACIRSNKTLIPDRAVLVSKLNPSIPRVWVPDCSGDVTKIASTEFLVFVPKPRLGCGLLSAIFSDRTFQQNLQGLATGTSKSHQRASPADVLRLECVTGEPKVFAAFESFVGPLMKKQGLMRKEIRTVAGLRDTLLPKLISGEIQLADAEEAIGAVV